MNLGAAVPTCEVPVTHDALTEASVRVEGGVALYLHACMPGRPDGYVSSVIGVTSKVSTNKTTSGSGVSERHPLYRRPATTLARTVPPHT